VSSNATFDVSPVAPWSLQAAQTLGGFGSVTGAVQTITGTTLRPGGVAAAGTLTFQSALVADSANLVFDVADVNTEGAGTNDLMVVNGPLTLSGTNVVNFNFLNGTPTLGVPYTLINYTGGLTGGAGNLASASGHINVTFNTAGGKVTVTFNSIGLDLVWRGDGSTNAWRSGVVSNWFNGTAMDLFFANDRVLFDDTATNYGVALAETVLPASVRVNTSSNYSITGAGKISGSTSLLKEGTGTLTLATVNDYLGGTTNTGGGTLDITNQFGALGSGALVMDGSTLLGHVSGSSATLPGQRRGLGDHRRGLERFGSCQDSIGPRNQGL
jgi:hypothetical protein